MQQFRAYEEEYGVYIQSAWLYNDVSLTINHRRTLITHSAALPRPMALVAVTTMIEVLHLGWVGRQFRFRYPLPDDGVTLAEATTRLRRDYRVPERRARRRLLPDAVIDQAEREAWEIWQLAEVCGMDEASCRARVEEWRQIRVVMDGPIPF